MDKKKIEVISEGKEDFQLAMRLAFSTNSKAVGYAVQENKFILFWTKHDSMIPFPYEMKVEQAIDFVWAWLEQLKPPYSQPDHDGDNECGFRVSNDNWGHVNDMWQAFIGIEFEWAMYGK